MKDVFLNHKMNHIIIMTYAVKTVENLFTWCGHERYTMMKENDNDFLSWNQK